MNLTKMSKEENTDCFEAGITEEQEKEYLAWENDETGEIEEPEWLWDLDYVLVRDKPVN